MLSRCFTRFRPKLSDGTPKSLDSKAFKFEITGKAIDHLSRLKLSMSQVKDLQKAT